MAIFQSWEQRNTALIRQFQQKFSLQKQIRENKYLWEVQR